MPLDPEDNIRKGRRRFLEVALHAHIVAAAESLCGTPDRNLGKLSEAIVHKFVQTVLLAPNPATAGKSSPNSVQIQSKFN